MRLPLLLAFGFSSVLPWIARYGYAGLALGVFLESAGVPVPGETALLAAAFSAAHGALALPWVIAVAATASVIGDNVGFAIGRRLGRGWVERHGHHIWLTPERLARVDRFFARYGAGAVALARFVTGVRVIAAFAAGTSRMRWAVFLPYNVFGALAWSTLVGLAGYAVGRGYAGASAWLGRSGVLLGVVVPIVLVGAWLLRRRAARTRAIGAGPEEVSGVRGIATHCVGVIGITTAALVAFAAIAEDVVEHETTPFDGAVRAWVLQHHTAGLDPVFTALMWLGSPVVLGVIATLGAVALWRARGARVGTAVGLPIMAIAAVELLKLLVQRVRPEEALEYAPLGYSFPSGHAMAAIALASTFGYVLTREEIAPRWSLPLALLFSILVGFSLLYLDAQLATDVIGGWAIGLALAAAGAAMYERFCVVRPAAAKPGVP